MRVLVVKVLYVTHTLIVSSIESSNTGVAPELLFLDHEFLGHDAVGVALGVDFEEAVHGFQWNSLCFRDEEEDEDDGEQHHRGEEHVDTESKEIVSEEQSGEGDVGKRTLRRPCSRTCLV